MSASLTCISIGIAAVACGDASEEGSGSEATGGESASSSSGPSSSGSGSQPGNGEPAELAGITEAHNVARANVMPAPATPMPPLTWDPALAEVAQLYAEECVFEHSGAPNLGENLYANTGTSTPDAVVGGWVSEVADYDYDSNSCAPDSQFGCGHYTQVVWADTLRVGCGVANCSTNSPFGSSSTWQHWVCNYDPPGNWVGEKPY
jgi:pathogenesis-related protein 1